MTTTRPDGSAEVGGAGRFPGTRLVLRLAVTGALVFVLQGCAWINPFSGSETSYEPARPDATMAGRVIAEAKRYLGAPYELGGESRRGIDCSGLTVNAFKAVGIALPRKSSEQAKVGMPVRRAELAPGDMVFFGSWKTSRINHVGIYLGSEKLIHASGARGVTVDSINLNYFRKNYVTARRLLAPGAMSAGR